MASEAKEIKEVESEARTIKSKEVLAMLAKAFSRLDNNKDGTISKQEFVAGVLKDKEVQKILHIPIEKTKPKTPESKDEHGVRRGSLKLREKDMARRAVRARNLGTTLKYFKRIDKDDSGTIDVNEFAAFFHSAELEDLIEAQLKTSFEETKHLSKDDVKMLNQLFNVLDSDQSGLVSYIELCEGIGPNMANDMFTTMDEDGNKYLEFGEILKALDDKFKSSKEEAKVKALGEIAHSCLKWSKHKKSTRFARTRFVPDAIVMDTKSAPKKADKKKNTENPIVKPKLTIDPKLAKLHATKIEEEEVKVSTDLLEAYVLKAGLNDSPYLSGRNSAELKLGLSALPKLDELKE
eukprot:CAMPEP_0167762000 /NCGR_PEP_ID=MMETSP0110_2-20121227/12500_1 /TAXON_ID=629695 /ORGANISM="Gymnochlora sp., Strain CCMP2014" /LENGTH=349 /DNA_ID=CAMNT_0007648777 /DNA_START=11 /DNA_END=1060 /DNA_ORIENTATION=+